MADVKTKVAASMAAIALGLIGLTSCSSGARSAPDAPQETPVETAAPEPVDLASPLEATVLENFPGGVPTDSQFFAITEYENMGASTVRLHVQENLDKTGRDELANASFNFAKSAGLEISTIVVRDASGIDSNHFA